MRFKIFPKILPLKSKKQGDLRNSLVLLGVTPMWFVAQWVSRAPPHHTLPPFLNNNSSLPEIALIGQSLNLCDTKHGTYVDFSGSGFLQSFGLEAMPLNKWIRLTIYRHAEFGDPDYDDLLFKFKFYDIDDGKLLEEISYADNFEYQYGGNENFKVFGSNPFSTDSDTHCYNSKFCYDSFDGEFKNLYFSDIKS